MMDAGLVNANMEDISLNADNEPESGERKLTCDQVVELIGFGAFQLKLLIVSGLIWITDAMELMVVSFLPAPTACEFGLGAFEQSLVVTFVFIGMFFGSVFFGWLADYWGRRRVYIIGCVTILVFGILSAASPNVYALYLFRGLCGFGIGSSHVAITLYAEYLPSSSRARILVFSQFFWAAGTIVESILAWWLLPTYGWRWLLAATTFPLVVSLACVQWFPESARWLSSNGRGDEAMATLAAAAAVNGKVLPPYQLAKQQSTMHQAPWEAVTQLLSTQAPGMLRGTLMLWLLWFSATFLYYGVVLITTTLYQLLDAGERCVTAPMMAMNMSSVASTLSTPMFTTTTAMSVSGAWVSTMDTTNGNATMTMAALPNPFPNIAGGKCQLLDTRDYIDILIQSFAEIPGIFFTAFIIDRFGRKKTQAIQYGVLAVMFAAATQCIGQTMLTVVLSLARAVVAGAFQVLWIYSPEFYPTSMRTSGVGACLAIARVGSLAAPFISQWLAGKHLDLAMLTFAAVAVATGVAAMLLPMETAGRPMVETLREMINITKLQNEGGDLLAAPAEASPAAGVVDKVVPLETAPTPASTSATTPKPKAKKPKAKPSTGGVGLEEAKD